MAASQDVQAILAALQGDCDILIASSEHDSQVTAAQQPAATPPVPVQQSPMPGAGFPAPAFSGVVPTPPPQQQSAYPPYPQPASSGSIDLNSIKPVSQGNVNFQDALARVQGFASARGIPPSSSTGKSLSRA